MRHRSFLFTGPGGGIHGKHHLRGHMGKLQVERQDLGPLLVSGDDMLWDSRTKGGLVNSNQKE